jgi:hypothetical protein
MGCGLQQGLREDQGVNAGDAMPSNGLTQAGTSHNLVTTNSA